MLHVYDTNNQSGIIETNLNDNEMSLRLQPIFSFKENTVVAYELLTRLNGRHETTETFFRNITSEELTKLLKHQISEINQSVIQKRIFINTKIECLDLDFIKWLSMYCEKPLAFELDYQDIQSADLTDEKLVTLNQYLKLMQNHGHQFWLDDFDGLFSQRAQLLLGRLSWNGIKLDKSVLWSLCSKEIKEFYRIIDLCSAFAPQTVVEGIESDYQLWVARKSKATFGQGFYWGDITM